LFDYFGCGVVLELPLTRKYVYLSRPHNKDKPVARKLQVSEIFNSIKLIMSRLIEARQPFGFREIQNEKYAIAESPISENTKCLLSYAFFVQHQHLFQCVQPALSLVKIPPTNTTFQLN
jgi:hypothetical protein